jgi:hypothetical protein
LLRSLKWNCFSWRRLTALFSIAGWYRLLFWAMIFTANKSVKMIPVNIFFSIEIGVNVQIKEHRKWKIPK